MKYNYKKKRKKKKIENTGNTNKNVSNNYAIENKWQKWKNNMKGITRKLMKMMKKIDALVVKNEE